MALEMPPPLVQWVGGEIAKERVPPPTDARVPTGVADFDQMAGGFPAGSVVLLLGDSGAGHQEFALTSAAHLMFHFDEERLYRFYVPLDRPNQVFPRGVGYVSLTRSREQILQEVDGSFAPVYREVLDRHLLFQDLSPSYFADTVVPSSWAAIADRGLLAASQTGGPMGDGPLAALADAIEATGKSNLVVVDSLTDLLVRRGVETSDLLTLLKGLRRRAKGWDGLVYLLLTRGVSSTDTEQALVDSVDAVLTFSWSQNPLRSSRTRTLLVTKSMPVLSHVPHEHQGRFVVRISSLTGLVTTQYERIQ